jgi:hypothetical protein
MGGPAAWGVGSGAIKPSTYKIICYEKKKGLEPRTWTDP